MKVTLRNQACHWILFVLTLNVHFRAVRSRNIRCHICIVTCDFWGLPAAGGTATAYHLLANSLASSGSTNWPVTLLGATRRTSLCEDAKQKLSSGAVKFECLSPEHFHPKVVENFPYEALGVAVVRWLKDAGRSCDIIHTHEWGGGMQQVASYASMHPEVRLIVEPHGGHFWSTQGTRERPTDLFALRIDDLERQTLQMAHDVKSPSAYMLAHLRQRGWHLPADSSVIPNIVPQAAGSSDARQVKQVWRLAFFGRLEERKGIKLFCEAIEMLDVTKYPKLEVMFIGGASQVDMMPSTKYLQQRTANWPVRVQLLGQLSRPEAMSVLKEKGTLIVLASLVENLPFALAEACIEEIPFITFNVGGVVEMLDSALHEDVIVHNISSVSLYQTIDCILSQGWAKTSTLTVGMKRGEKLWHSLHKQHDQNRRRRTSSGTPLTVQVVSMELLQKCRVLKNDICTAKDTAETLLLVPANFQIPSLADLTHIKYLASQLQRLVMSHRLGALVFGSRLPNSFVSYPSTPTWITYHGTEPLCVENNPLLILKDLFCSLFLPEAGDFELFHTWLLIKHLNGAGLITTAFPDPVFSLLNFSRSDPGCFSDRIPSFRKLSGDRVGNLLGPAEDVLMGHHLAVWPRPVTAFREDFHSFQGHRGWYYISYDEFGQENSLQFWEAKQQWACDTDSPASISQTSLHPCASRPVEGGVCCGRKLTVVGVRYVSNIRDPSAFLDLTFEVWPTCGDGLVVEGVLVNQQNLESRKLFSKAFAPSSDPPQRETVAQTIPLLPGDSLVVLVDPLDNHDCDGVYIQDIKLWTST
ncbi:TPA: hypothetical protein ACH3X2_010559 [Trebouxia sp. C0005]